MWNFSKTGIYRENLKDKRHEQRKNNIHLFVRNGGNGSVQRTKQCKSEKLKE